MRFGSVCSGIEAASVAWNPLGWRAAWLSEIEPFPAAVLAHHYPDVPNLGDMTTLPARIASGEVDAPDVFCGGTPCQAFSVAGLRKSLDDARGNLSLTFCEIANEIDAARSIRGEQPAIVFWENVPGVLNTKDNAFGCFLAGLAGEDDPLIAPGGKWTNAGCVFGPKRTVAWRVLDAQYFGVAQRRRRVFVVASARDGFDPAKVLFEFDSVRRDIAPSRETRKGATASSTSRAGVGSQQQHYACGGIGSYHSSSASATLLKTGQDLVPGCETIITMAHGQGGAEIATDRSPTLTCNHEAPIAAYGIPGNWIGRKPENGGNAVEPMHNVAPCLTSTDRHGVAVGAANPTAVAYALQHAQIGRKDSAGPQGKGWQEGLAFTQDSRSCADVVVTAYSFDSLASNSMKSGTQCANSENLSPTLGSMGHDGGHANGGGQVAVAFAQNSRDEVRLMNGDGQIVGALAAEPGMKQTCYVAQYAVALSVSLRGREGVATAELGGEIQNCLRASSGGGDKPHVLADVQPKPFQQTADCLTASYGTKWNGNSSADNGSLFAAHAMQVRRLTPTECERLQGFHDGYTAIPWRKKPASDCPDGPRYKALGNSWAAPVVRWIGQRISDELARIQAERPAANDPQVNRHALF